MQQQFYRLFLFLVLSCALVIWSFSQIVEQLYPEHNQYMLNIESLIAPEHPLPSRSLIARNQLALPESLANLLEQGKTIALAHDATSLYYYQLSADPTQVVRLGPLQKTAQTEDVMPILLLAFYGCLTLIAIMLIWPVFRDLQRLQKTAIEFGENPQHLTLNISKHSAIYPLAKAFNKVANQIVNLVDLHKALSKIISHEVRTPLARMRFALALSQQQLAPQYQQRLNADLDEIEQLATSYLSFAKLEHLQHEKTLQPVLLVEFIEKLRPRFTHLPPAITLRFSSQGEQACFDPAAISIVVQNLVTNAARFAKQQIEVQLTANDQGWSLSVEDDGPGFLQSTQDVLKAFKRQQQDDKGFGLGLYIVSQIANWHQAQVQVKQSASLGGAAVSISTQPTPP
ncbi:ATP-binding protein [Rheinheimera sp. UJ63]|uniref:ATP-binding protein n=1 Tax=Rheinheimera sp. UJ63 TaxID=2910157 RepID=UPI001F2AA852|nr:ATP-binding protein [Rheinheimera sp. UJ63]MCF4010915.1 ATP-binding protein [Rheinheimera sp. UJ63]